MYYVLVQGIKKWLKSTNKAQTCQKSSNRPNPLGTLSSAIKVHQAKVKAFFKIMKNLHPEKRIPFIEYKEKGKSNRLENRQNGLFLK